MKDCQHKVLRLMMYRAEVRYICADDDHPECHQVFVVERQEDS
jgi:hypothetical protein